MYLRDVRAGARLSDSPVALFGFDWGYDIFHDRGMVMQILCWRWWCRVSFECPAKASVGALVVVRPTDGFERFSGYRRVVGPLWVKGFDEEKEAA